MRTMVVAVVVALPAIGLVGCGGESAAQKAEAKRAACEAEVGTFVEALQDIGGRLDVGIVYADYQTKVGDIAAARNRIDSAALDAECLEVVAAGEKALNRYSRAAAFWSRCLKSDRGNCGTRETMLAGLRENWRVAKGLEDAMISRLNALGRAD